MATATEAPMTREDVVIRLLSTATAGAQTEVPRPAPTMPLSARVELPPSPLQAVMEQAGQFLAAAREEAEELGYRPLTLAAEQACLSLLRAYTRKNLWRKKLRFMATAKLDGGATFIVVNDLNQKRVDFEFDPNGRSGKIVQTDERLRIRTHKDAPTPEVLDKWISWLRA